MLCVFPHCANYSLSCQIEDHPLHLLEQAFILQSLWVLLSICSYYTHNIDLHLLQLLQKGNASKEIVNVQYSSFVIKLCNKVSDVYHSHFLLCF